MLKVNFSNRQRKTKLPDNTKSLVISAIDAALTVEDFYKNSEVNVTFVSDKKIKEINSELTFYLQISFLMQKIGPSPFFLIFYGTKKRLKNQSFFDLI